MALPLTQDDQKLVLQEYYCGTSIKQIAKKISRRTKIVSDFLHQQQINIAENRVLKIIKAQSGIPRSAIYQASSLNINISNIQWAYIAGIFDGEGHVGAINNNQNYRISIAQKDISLLSWLQQILGGGFIIENPHAKVGYFRINAQKQVYQFLIHVLPFLIVKRNKVQEICNYMQVRYRW